MSDAHDFSCNEGIVFVKELLSGSHAASLGEPDFMNFATSGETRHPRSAAPPRILKTSTRPTRPCSKVNRDDFSPDLLMTGSKSSEQVACAVVFAGVKLRELDPVEGTSSARAV